MPQKSEGERRSWMKPASVVVTMLGAALLVASFFLPYASSTGDYRAWLEANPDGMYAEELGMTNADAADLSLLEYARTYAQAEVFGLDSLFIVYTFIIAAVLVFSLVGLVLAALRKPIGTMVFSVLSFATVLLLNWDFQERGVVSGSLYDWGIAKWVYVAAFVVTLAGAVWLLVVRVQEKRARRNRQGAQV